MEIEYQITKADYRDFYRAYFASELKKRIVPFILTPLVIAFLAGGNHFKWQLFLVVFFAVVAAFFLFLYMLPYLIVIQKLNRAISKDSAYLEKKKLSTTETGLIIQSVSKTTERNWQSINSFSSDENYIRIQLLDEKSFLIPKRFFASESEVVNFLGIVQTGIIKTRGTLNLYPPGNVKTYRPPYWLGLLCLIPLIGAFVGLGLLLYGVLKYKDKWLSIIGAGGIVWTIVVYSTLFYTATHASIFKKGWADISQMQLNSLTKNIEFYKLEHGQYPDSLKQLLNDDKFAPIYDPIQGAQFKKNAYYNYEKVGDKYLLFSSGQDGIPNTKDDLFPQLTLADSNKIGLIKHH
jgi:hypothetical protein